MLPEGKGAPRARAEATPAPRARVDAKPAERPELIAKEAEVKARIAEINVEIRGLSDGGWQARGKNRHRVNALLRERDWLSVRLKLNTLGVKLENAANKVIGRSQEEMTRLARDRGALDGVPLFFNQMEASTLESVVAVGSATGRLAELDGVSGLEDAVKHPVRTGSELGKGVVQHVKDIYERNGPMAAAGDVASLGLEVFGEAKLMGDTLELAQRVARPAVPALTNALVRTTGITAEAAAPVAKGTVQTLVVAEVAKEGLKLAGLTAETEEIGDAVHSTPKKQST
jgi:hypothetical protein